MVVLKCKFKNANVNAKMNIHEIVNIYSILLLTGVDLPVCLSVWLLFKTNLSLLIMNGFQFQTRFRNTHETMDNQKLFSWYIKKEFGKATPIFEIIIG